MAAALVRRAAAVGFGPAGSGLEIRLAESVGVGILPVDAELHILQLRILLGPRRHNLSLVNPHLDADAPHSRVRLGQRVVNVGAQAYATAPAPIISFSVRAISAPEMRPLVMIFTPSAPACIVRSAACRIARR